MTPLTCHVSGVFFENQKQFLQILAKIKNDVISRFFEVRKLPLENLNFIG